MFCLHTVFLPRINESLAVFTESQNNHAISTERMQTPLQLCTRQIDVSGSSSSDESVSNMDSDSESTLPSHDPVPVHGVQFSNVSS